MNNGNGDILGAFATFMNEYQVWQVVKVFVLAAIILYCLFVFAIFRQTTLMHRVLQIPIKPSFKTIAAFYLLIAIGYFFLAFLVL